MYYTARAQVLSPQKEFLRDIGIWRIFFSTYVSTDIPTFSDGSDTFPTKLPAVRDAIYECIPDAGLIGSTIPFAERDDYHINGSNYLHYVFPLLNFVDPDIPYDSNLYIKLIFDDDHYLITNMGYNSGNQHGSKVWDAYKKMGGSYTLVGGLWLSGSNASSAFWNGASWDLSLVTVDNLTSEGFPETVNYWVVRIGSALNTPGMSHVANDGVYSSTVYATFFNDITGRYLENDDPYNLGGSSAPGGGGGAQSDTSDVIDFPSLPTLSAVGTGFITLYNPSLSQLLTLSNYMWNSDPTTIDFWKKIVANPMDLILGLNIIPVAVPNSGAKDVVIGAVDTEILMTYTDTQYVEVDCGTINIPEFWGAYLDYSPYTKIEIYLPYCGTHPIIADEIVGKSISVRYHVDILSGACVAYVKCGNSVLYEFAGNCSAQIPVTSNQFGDMVRSAISIASAIGSMVATDGATAPLAISSIASASTNSTALKPNVEKSGAVGGMAGQLGIQKPYLIITRPKVCVPDRQNKYIGYPTYTTVVLSELEGYNEISAIHIEGVPATESEISELENILKTGVIF